MPTLLDELERRAEAALTPQAWSYVAGGAGIGATMRANRAAFDRWRIVPRMLRDVSARDLTIELFGEAFAAPILLAPVGALELAHGEADLAVARAAAAEGVPMIISNQASVPVEAIARANGSGRRWFQLYWSTSADVVTSFVRRAEESGCGAIVLTLDSTMLGWRTHDLDLGWIPFLRGMGIAQYTSDPAFRAELRGRLESPGASPRVTLATFDVMLRMMFRGWKAGLSVDDVRRSVLRFTATYSRPSLSWVDLPFLRGLTKLPIVLKGIQHPDDARRAVDAGVNAIVVSNHGGRQVDGAIASLDALPPVVDAVQGRIPVLFDSGIRTGADVFKALALGATAVLLGRPYVYGLAIGGEAGVRDVLSNIIAELDLTLGLSGHTSVRELSPGALMLEG